MDDDRSNKDDVLVPAPVLLALGFHFNGHSRWEHHQWNLDIWNASKDGVSADNFKKQMDRCLESAQFNAAENARRQVREALGIRGS